MRGKGEAVTVWGGVLRRCIEEAMTTTNELVQSSEKKQSTTTMKTEKSNLVKCFALPILLDVILRCLLWNAKKSQKMVILEFILCDVEVQDSDFGTIQNSEWFRMNRFSKIFACLAIRGDHELHALSSFEHIFLDHFPHRRYHQSQIRHPIHRNSYSGTNHTFEKLSKNFPPSPAARPRAYLFSALWPVCFVIISVVDVTECLMSWKIPKWRQSLAAALLNHDC